ncbi:MAG: peptidyl-prolyl cis-trans isomerase [Candidatus Omnitrophota bacterium]|jgi:parvulin-like peptidyl-prolyl isomerase
MNIIKRFSARPLWAGLLALLFCCSPLFAQDKIVAIVDKDVITQKDLNDFINFMRLQLSSDYQGKELETKIQSMKLDLLEKLIEDHLIAQKARKEGITVSPERIKGRINEIKKAYGSEGEFQNALSKQGLVQADLEKKIMEQMLMFATIDRQVKSTIIVNPAEVTDFYYQNPSDFVLPEQREFESIALNDRSLANEIYEKLKGGEDIQAVADGYSLTVNKLTSVKNGELRKDIEDIVFRMNAGEISQPVRIEGVYYIIKVNNVMPPRQQSLTEVQDRIYTMIYNMKMEDALSKWIDEMKNNSYIKILQSS